MNKENVMYTCDGVLFSLKKDGMLSYPTTGMNLKDVILSERGQSQKYNTI